MYTIEIYLRGSDKHSEVLPDDPEATELLIEDVISQALLELFEVVDVEGVTVRFWPSKYSQISPAE
jgi:hypothetical protein